MTENENRDVLSRHAPPPDLTLAYGDLPDHVADVWFSGDKEDAAVSLIILWHGGFWRSEFDRTHLRPLASELAAAGYVVVTPEYRRTGGDGGGGWPKTFVDVSLAADSLPDLVAPAFPGRVDLDRVIYAGHSAGGQLAVWASRRHLVPVGTPGYRATMPRVAGVVALAPVLDLAEAYRLDLDGGAVMAFLGGSPDEFPEAYAATDPMRIGGDEPIVTILHGDADGRVPIALSREYRDRLGGRLLELPGADHFAVIDPYSAEWPTILSVFAEMRR